MLDTTTRTLPTILSAVLACAALTFVGCGEGDGGGGGGTFSSGVPANTPLNELTDQQRNDFCSEAESFQENYYSDADFERLACMAAGLFAGSFEGGQAACQEAFDECVKNPPPLEDGEFICEVEELSEDCDITVGDYERCVNDSASQTDDMLDAFSCDKVNWETGEIEGFSQELPASCMAFAESCAGI